MTYFTGAGEFVGALLLYLGVLQEHEVAENDVLASVGSCESPSTLQAIGKMQ